MQYSHFHPTFTSLCYLTGRTRVCTVCGRICCIVQAAFVLPQTFPVTSKTLNYSGVAVGIATLAAIFFWFLPGGLGARSWYRGKIETANLAFDSVRGPHPYDAGPVSLRVALPLCACSGQAPQEQRVCVRHKWVSCQMIHHGRRTSVAW